MHLIRLDFLDESSKINLHIWKPWVYLIGAYSEKRWKSEAIELSGIWSYVKNHKIGQLFQKENLPHRPAPLKLQNETKFLIWLSFCLGPFLLLFIPLFISLFKKRRRQNKKEIFISVDCWLEVFALLPPSQLGLGIALISRRFDRRVDEHFKTRKWILDKELRIQKKKQWFGRKEMEIVNANEGKALPIPQIRLPNKIIGVRGILITYFDHNVLTFLGHFYRFFASSTTYLAISNENVRSLEFFLSTIWPLLHNSIRHVYLYNFTFRRVRQLAPSILNDCPSLRFFNVIGDILPEFPPDDSANATDGQAVVKWLFTPSPDGVPKLLKYTENSSVEEWPSIIEQFKAAFSAASSRACFSIFFKFVPSSSIDFVVPSFLLTNELTGEHLALFQYDANDEECFVLNRWPIAPDERERKWYKLMKDGQ